mmetsp:Transcript_37195/g.107406  ORF Transcript_37195/g.107406 Transcript_37195/m.107406 type:complete len:119 (+) Transcript_37195:518-874(+)
MIVIMLFFLFVFMGVMMIIMILEMLVRFVVLVMAVTVVAMVGSAFLVTVIVSVRVRILEGPDFFFESFDFCPQCTNVAADSYLLRCGQLGQGILNVFWDWFDHFLKSYDTLVSVYSLR